MESPNVGPVNACNSTSASQTAANVEGTTTRQWKLHELGLLIAAKRMEHEKSANLSTRNKIKSADQKWREIQLVLVKDGVLRQATQIKKRWEKLMTDFKKVYDYQNHVGSGQPSYYEMGSKDKKSRKLPVNLAHELFESMECWLGNNRVINPSENQVVDPGTIEDNTKQGAQFESEQTTRVGDDIPCELEVEVDSPPPEGMENLGVEGRRARTPPEASQYTGVKKNRRDKLDEQFKKTTTTFLDFLGKDYGQRSLHDTSILGWEKDKHDRLVALELKKHEEIVEQQSKMTDAMSNAIVGVSDSIRFFATQVAFRN